jgi:biotin carboxyl carrier protein
VAKYYLKLGDREIDADVTETPDGLSVDLGDGPRRVDLIKLGSTPRFTVVQGDRMVDVLAVETKDAIEVLAVGESYTVGTTRSRKGRGGKHEEGDSGEFEDGKWLLRAPITGSIVEIRVAVGDRVEAGAVLLTVEAMKMQNELRSRVAGQVAAIKAEKGQRVETGSVLVEVTP